MKGRGEGLRTHPPSWAELEENPGVPAPGLPFSKPPAPARRGENPGVGPPAPCPSSLPAPGRTRAARLPAGNSQHSLPFQDQGQSPRSPLQRQARAQASGAERPLLAAPQGWASAPAVSRPHSNPAQLPRGIRAAQAQHPLLAASLCSRGLGASITDRSCGWAWGGGCRGQP